jgi:hypothetical protein
MQCCLKKQLERSEALSERDLETNKALFEEASVLQMLL